MKAGLTRTVFLLALVIAAVSTWMIARRPPLAVEDSRLTWLADAHQFGPVGYRDPAAAISPDGRWVAYSEGRFLRVQPAEGGPLVDLPAGEAQIRNIVWAGDSQRLLADGFETQTGWAVYDIVAGTRRRLWADHDPLRARVGDSGAATTSAKVSDLRQLAWSRTGRIIAAIVNGREGQQLWTLTEDGAAGDARRFPHRIAFPA